MLSSCTFFWWIVQRFRSMLELAQPEIALRIKLKCRIPTCPVDLTDLVHFQLTKQLVHLIKNNLMKKGDVLNTARIASITAAKLTSTIIPLCHNIQISYVNTEFRLDEVRSVTNILTRSLFYCADGCMFYNKPQLLDIAKHGQNIEHQHDL